MRSPGTLLGPCTELRECISDPRVWLPTVGQADAEPTVLPAVARLVAIGDLHGDMHKARRAFRLGGLTDENDHWVGGTTTAVQVGPPLPMACRAGLQSYRADVHAGSCSCHGHWQHAEDQRKGLMSFLHNAR